MRVQPYYFIFYKVIRYALHEEVFSTKVKEDSIKDHFPSACITSYLVTI